MKKIRNTHNSNEDKKNISKKKSIFIFNRFYLSIIISFLFILDIGSKSYFNNKYYFSGHFFYILSSHNFGSALSLFSNILWYNYFIGIIGIIAILTLFYYRSQFRGFLLYIWILLVAGILGNTYDRLIYGYTRDFIGFGNLFICNLADFYFTIAVILYIVYEFKSKLDSNKE